MSIHTFYISPTQPIFQTVHDHLHDFLHEQGGLLTESHRKEILLALVEAVQNGRIHGGRPQEVKVELSTTPYQMLIRVWDRNPAFSIAEGRALPEDPFSESGRGLGIIRALVDYMSVEHTNEGNCLTLLKTFKADMAQVRDDLLLDLLYEISESIVQANEVNFERIYELVLDRAIDIFGVDRASIMNIDPERGVLKIVASRGISPDVVRDTSVVPGEGVSGRVFEEAQPMIVDRRGAEGDSLYKSDSFISAPLLCSPMRLGGTCIGVINITERRNGEPFDEKDLKLLTTLANQTAAYIRIGQLIDRLKRSQKMEQELDLARSIQRSLLPQAALRDERAEVFGYCEMAREVGGDYFDYVWNGSSLYLAVADVSGHNLSAALTMISFRSLLRSHIALGGGPAQILTRVNAQMFDDLLVNDQQITAAVLCLDFETRTIRYANAGHHPVFYLGRRSKLIEHWFSEGILLGFIADAKFEEQKRVWEPGDTLLLYTDGIVEARNDSGVPFGAKRLEAFLLKHRTLAPSMSVPGILNDLHRYIGTRVPDDDVTLMQLSLK